MERGWPKWRLEEVNRRRRTRARKTNGTHDRRLPFPINPYTLLVKFIARLISGQITRLTRTTRRADSLSCQGRAPAEKASTRYTRRGTVARDRKNGRPPAVVGRKKTVKRLIGERSFIGNFLIALRWILAIFAQFGVRRFYPIAQ